MNDVAHVKELKTNIMSVSKMTEKEYVVTYNKKEAVVGRRGKTIFKVPKKRGAYIYESKKMKTRNERTNEREREGERDRVHERKREQKHEADKDLSLIHI